jgi:hypothetical protein
MFLDVGRCQHFLGFPGIVVSSGQRACFGVGCTPWPPDCCKFAAHCADRFTVRFRSGSYNLRGGLTAGVPSLGSTVELCEARVWDELHII